MMNKSEGDFTGEHELIYITKDELKKMLEAAADEALKKQIDFIYIGVGKTVLGKLFWAVGALVVGAYLYFKHTGDL